MSESSLIQEQRDLFHRLQQIIETDRKARAIVMSRRGEIEGERQRDEFDAVKEWEGASKKVSNLKENFFATFTTIFIIGLIILLALVLCSVMSSGVGLEVFFILLAIILSRNHYTHLVHHCLEG